MSKIRAIIKRPDEPVGHVTHISNTLKSFQKVVDGPIETVFISSNVVMLVNEEGKIRGLQPNFWIGTIIRELIVGTVCLVGTDGDEFVDCPMELETWKRLLNNWER